MKKSLQLLCLVFGLNLLSGLSAEPNDKTVQVTLYEGINKKNTFDLSGAKQTLSYTEPAFGFVTIPIKYSSNALALDRSTPFALEATLEKRFPAGLFQFRLRSKGSAQLRLTQGEQSILIQTKPQTPHKSCCPIEVDISEIQLW